jgi:hypothetical protein
MIGIDPGIAMSKDPLALSAVTAGPPHEAEYDAVYAAVTATERGRWFLTEFADRNREADTHLVMAALARIEAAIRGDAAPLSSSALWRDLTGIAAAIEQARVIIAAEATPASEITAAVERIQDIAFTLRERAVDASLCDAIDAALRDIADASRPQRANGNSTNDAAELLHDLAGRVDALIKQALGGDVSTAALAPTTGQIPDVPQPAAVAAETAREKQAAAADEDVSQLDQFIMELSEANKPSESAASLALSLTSAASAIDRRNEFGGGLMQLPAEKAQSESSAPTYRNGGARWHIEGPDFVFHSPTPETAAELTMSSEDFGRTYALLPEPQMPEPDEDPAGLFDTSLPAAAEVPMPPPQIANGKATPAVIDPSSSDTIRPAASDSFAALRGISEDELNALFG